MLNVIFIADRYRLVRVTANAVTVQNVSERLTWYIETGK
jgi:hypothetical protein